MAGAASLPEFGDFDDEVVYNRCRQALLQVDTLNFVIDFDGTKAYAVENLSVATLQQLLLVEVNDSGQSRTRNDNLFSVSDPCKNREADFEQLQRPKHTNTRWM